VRSFEFFGGVPAQLVPDNLKAGVTKACFYDPEINRTYGDMAAHYDTAIVPARPGKPKDKAKVEGAVLLVERWILARLRNQHFFGLDEVNAAIRQSEYHTQHQRGFGRQIRVKRLASSRLATWGRPARQRVRRYPKGHTATAAKARLILRPVRHFELHLTDVMAAAGVMFVRHAGSINLFSIPVA